MRVNLPVSNSEYDFPGNELLMSTTDSKGVITHCNAAFMRPSRTCGPPSVTADAGKVS